MTIFDKICKPLRTVDTHNLQKLYYSIGEVASMFDVNASLIRFWEKEFDLIQPKKNKKGNRLFTVRDIANFNKIYQLVKVKGYTLEGAKNELKGKSPLPSPDNSDDLLERLYAIRDRLIALKD